MAEEKPAATRDWGIKSMDDALSNLAVAYARRNQMSVADLVAEALRMRLDPTYVEPERHLDIEELIAIAGNPAIARWLRSAANRQLARYFGIKPPARPRRITVAVGPTLVLPQELAAEPQPETEPSGE